MNVRKISFAVASCAIAILLQPLLLSACSSNSKAKSVEAVHSTSSQSSQISQSPQPDFGASVVQQASLYNSSSGRVALSMLICRFDSSYIYSDLVKKSAKELFDIVSETAVEKNVTLESLNSRYGLCDILASEKIYVSIESNNVTSQPKPSLSSSSKVSVASSSATSVKLGSKASSKALSKVSSSIASTASSDNDVTWVDKFQKAILQTSVK